MKWACHLWASRVGAFVGVQYLDQWFSRQISVSLLYSMWRSIMEGQYCCLGITCNKLRFFFPSIMEDWKIEFLFMQKQLIFYMHWYL